MLDPYHYDDSEYDWGPRLSSLPEYILVLIFSHPTLSSNDLRSLRLVSKEVSAASTAAIRHLRPTKGDELLPRFSGAETVDYTTVALGTWSESSLACLSQARGLSALRFGHSNYITPTGAEIIAGLRNLKSIEVLDAQLTDGALHRWSALKGLTSLCLLGCKDLTASGLKMIGALKELQTVELGSCTGVTDAVLVELGSLPKLRKVDLSSCDSFTETGLAALGTASCLRTLLLPACWHIDDAMLYTLCSSPITSTLECLSLFEAGEGISDEGLVRLTALTRLTGLDLGYSCWAHTSAGLEKLVRALPTGLKMLNIGGAEGVTDGVLGIVASTLTELTMLDMSECQRATLAGVESISQLPSIQELHLGWNLRLADGALTHLPRELTKLDLSYCSELSLVSLPAESLKKLSSLQARRCPLLNDDGLKALVAAAPALRHLDISYCATISSAGLRCLSSLSKLSSLNFSGCPRAVTVVGLGYLANISSLKTLEASNNPRLDNGCMQAVSFVRQLKNLSLRGCPRITNHGILALARISRLESLEIDGRNVTQSAIDKLCAKCPRLRRVQVICRDPVRRIYDYYADLGVADALPQHYY